MNLSNQDFTSVPSFSWQQGREQQKMELQEDSNDWAMSGIPYPGKHDVMLGRGGESNYHTGNLAFRDFIQEHKKRYQKARKQEKPIIALEVVLAWRDLSPPGRFLARTDPSRADSLWEDVGDDLACKRAGRTLGEKSTTKTSSKQQEDGSCSSHDIQKPFAALSADKALSSAPFPTVPSKANRGKRSQASIDFIASIHSRQKLEPPPSKKQRSSAFSSVGSDFVAASLSACSSPESSSGTGSKHKSFSTRNAVDSTNSCSSPPRSRKVVSPEVSSLDIGFALEGAQREEAYSLRESIPTAEFLTRCFDF